MPIADVHQTSSTQGEPGGLMACRLDGPVAVVTMNHRPYNLMGRGFTEQLIDALRWVGESGARAAILHSGLRHFSAGADLDDMVEAAGCGDGTLGWPILEMLQAFDELPIPIVAAVPGNCPGGAKEMALLGRRYDARTLERWNVINWVVADEQLDQTATTLARELAAGPTLAHTATK